MEHSIDWAPLEPTTLFIGGLSQDTTEEELVRYVERFCPVTQIKLPLHNVTGRRLGYAFVVVSNKIAAEAVVTRTNFIGGRTVECQIALDKRDKETYKQDLLRRKVFIAGIKSQVNFQNILYQLSHYGAIKHCYRIAASHTNRGLAFAEFYDYKAAECLVSDGLFVDGCSLRVTYFRPKEEFPKNVGLSQHYFSSQEEPHKKFYNLTMDKKKISSVAFGSKTKSKSKEHNRLFHQKPPDGDKAKEIDNYQFRICVNRNKISSQYEKVLFEGAILVVKAQSATADLLDHNRQTKNEKPVIKFLLSEAEILESTEILKIKEIIASGDLLDLNKMTQTSQRKN